MGNKPAVRLTKTSVLLGLACIVSSFYLASYIAPSEDGGDSSGAPNTSDHQSPEWNHLPPVTLEEASDAIRKAIETDDEFQVHYTAAYLAKRLDSKTLAALVSQAEQFKDPHNNIVQLILALSLSHRDPNAFIELIKDDDFHKRAKFNLGWLFQYLAKDNPQLAFETAIQIQSSRQQQALSGIYQSQNPQAQTLVRTYREEEQKDRNRAEYLAARDRVKQTILQNDFGADTSSFKSDFFTAYHQYPTEGLKLSLEIKDPEIRKQIASSLLYSSNGAKVETLDFLSKHASAIGFHAPSERIRAIAQSTNNIGKEELASVMNWISQNLTSEEQNAFLTTQPHILYKHPSELLESSLLRDAPISQNKNSIIDGMLGSLAQSDLDAAIAYISSESDPKQKERLTSAILAQAYKSKGPQSAIALFEQIESPGQQHQALQNLGNAWGQEDPLSFFEWSAQTFDLETLANASHSPASIWATNDLPTAMEFEKALPEGALKNTFQNAIGNHLANQSPKDAFTYGRSISNSNTQPSFLWSAANNWSRIEPEVATPFIVESYSQISQGESNFYNNTYNVIQHSARNWAEVDPQATALYFSQDLPKQIKGIGLPLAMAQWLAQDEANALDHFEGLIQQPTEDEILRNLALHQEIAWQYPDTARLAISAISDPATRTSMTNALENLIKRKPHTGGTE